jgi:hypothetical protein
VWIRVNQCPTGLIRKEFGDSKSLERLRQQYPQNSYHNAQSEQKVAVTQESLTWNA